MSYLMAKLEDVIIQPSAPEGELHPALRLRERPPSEMTEVPDPVEESKKFRRAMTRLARSRSR